MNSLCQCLQELCHGFKMFMSSWEDLDMAWKQFQHEECVKDWSRVNPKLIKILLGIFVSTKKDCEFLKIWHLDTA